MTHTEPKTDQRDGIDDLVKLSFFSDIGKAIASTTSLRETLRAVMDQIGLVFAPANWSLLLRNARTGELRFVVVVGSGVEELRGMILPRGTGIAGWIAENGEPLIIEDVSSDRRFTNEMDRKTGFKTQSIIGVPLKNRGRTFGVIELVNKIDGSHFTPLELKLLTTIADFAAIAIERVYYMRALRTFASTDELTGLSNRRVFLRFLDKEVERFKRTREVFSVMMVDIDDFKQINDLHGHRTGDAVLKVLADIMRESVRKADLVCRYGGDEFLVLMPSATKETALLARNRVVGRITAYNAASDTPFHVSVGVHEVDGEHAETILETVDANMYREKAGKMETSITEMSQNIEEFLSEEDSESTDDSSE